MMTQVQAPFNEEQAITQFELKQYLQGQARAVAPLYGANYSLQSMTQGFLSSADNPNTPGASLGESQTAPDREPIKHLLIGSPKAVKSTIHYLQVTGYADAAAWSPLVPTANPGEVMSILTRYILVQ